MDWSGKIPDGHVLVECEDCRCFHHIPEQEFDELPGDYYVCDSCADKAANEMENAPYSIHDDEFQEEIAEVLGQRIVRCWNCGEPAEEHELVDVDEDDFLCQDCIETHQQTEAEREFQDSLFESGKERKHTEQSVFVAWYNWQLKEKKWQVVDDMDQFNKILAIARQECEDDYGIMVFKMSDVTIRK